MTRFQGHLSQELKDICHKISRTSVTRFKGHLSQEFKGAVLSVLYSFGCCCECCGKCCCYGCCIVLGAVVNVAGNAVAMGAV